jgi:hypothetical protein
LQEASRAIRKKLKYGNVHRQIRALVILRALTENAGKGFQLNWANEMLMDRLKTMANDVCIIGSLLHVLGGEGDDERAGKREALMQ